MKYNAILLALASLVLAAPSPDVDITTVTNELQDITTVTDELQDITTVTDELLFNMTLPQFQARRNIKNPGTLDWSSDGCTSSPNNPFGFPFLAACHRHDFGFQNYRIQMRFTKASRDKINSLFQTDLYYQCQSVFAQTVCERLADIYYAAVSQFGGGDATKRGETGPSYEKAVKAYDEAVKEAQAEGLLPTLEY